METLKELLKQPYWILALCFGAVLVALPCVTVASGWQWQTHSPNSYPLFIVGLTLLVVSAVAFGFVLWLKRGADGLDMGAGLNLAHVKESNGRIWTSVSRCEIGVISGRVEDHPRDAAIAVALPCDEYFDNCAEHPTSALGAFTKRVFEGQVDVFQSIIERECQKTLAPAIRQEKATGTFGLSFGPGKCVLTKS